MKNVFASLILLPLYMAIPAVILYFIIKNSCKKSNKRIKR